MALGAFHDGKDVTTLLMAFSTRVEVQIFV